MVYPVFATAAANAVNACEIVRRSGWIADGAAIARSSYAFAAACRSSLPPPVAARNACANLEPMPASCGQFPELANPEAGDEGVVDDVEDALDVDEVRDAGVVTDDFGAVVALPQPVTSATAASVAKTVPIFMKFTSHHSTSRSTAHILDRLPAG